MTLGDLRARMTYEELSLWVAFLTMQNEDQEKRMQKASRGRRR